ncbi:TIR domain-containing protein [Caballeronia humi]|uniref:Nucleotide-binding protein n=1 Tax=Caballeronia humi TaxID=326474 RepID=A0A158IT13_9BURK|nr:nucleotide-binding protein [Caballeronia humi]SAL59696.1 nucleotide-binding protein [Caballeronia humi]
MPETEKFTQSDYFSLLVSSEPGHWNSGQGDTPASRYLNETVEAVTVPFTPLDDAAAARLKAMPAVFACETNTENPTPARLGRITRIQHRQAAYYLHFEFDEAVPPISQSALAGLARELDINQRQRGIAELSTTHWAVKQADLYDVLRRHGLVDLRPAIEGAPESPVRSRPLQAGVDALVGSTGLPRVFIVHGRAKGAKHEVARWIDGLGLKAVILDEQISVGETIIEQFEREAKAISFAVVLLTPDDVGGLQVTNVVPPNLQPRARQNVIFELGYFAAKLGRGKVCALREGNVEVPSDYSGVRYIGYDDHGGWKLPLVQVLRSAGLPVDLSRL